MGFEHRSLGLDFTTALAGSPDPGKWGDLPL